MRKVPAILAGVYLILVAIVLVPVVTSDHAGFAAALTVLTSPWIRLLDWVMESVDPSALGEMWVTLGLTAIAAVTNAVVIYAMGSVVEWRMERSKRRQTA